MAGGSLQNALTTATTITGRGYTNDNLIGSIANAATIQVSDGYGQYKYTAMFGRITYNWENKYIINLNGRRDGSSRFAPGRQFGNFGSVGVSWNLSEEAWMKKNAPGMDIVHQDQEQLWNYRRRCYRRLSIPGLLVCRFPASLQCHKTVYPEPACEPGIPLAEQ